MNRLFVAVFVTVTVAVFVTVVVFVAVLVLVFVAVLVFVRVRVRARACAACVRRHPGPHDFAAVGGSTQTAKATRHARVGRRDHARGHHSAWHAAFAGLGYEPPTYREIICGPGCGV